MEQFIIAASVIGGTFLASGLVYLMTSPPKGCKLREKSGWYVLGNGYIVEYTTLIISPKTKAELAKEDKNRLVEKVDLVEGFRYCGKCDGCNIISRHCETCGGTGMMKGSRK